MHNPTKISSLESLVLLNMGSNIAVNNVKEERQTIVTDTLEALIAPKKSIQCKPTIAPVKKSLVNVILSIFKSTFVHFRYKNNVIEAMNTRYQTNWISFIEIKAPSIPVKPHINTVKCRMNKLL